MFKNVSLVISILFILLITQDFAYTLGKSSQRNDARMTKPFLTINNALAAEQVIHSSKDQVKLPQKGNNMEPPLSAYIVPGTVGIFIIIGLGGYWLLFRRKQI